MFTSIVLNVISYLYDPLYSPALKETASQSLWVIAIFSTFPPKIDADLRSPEEYYSHKLL